LNRLNYFQSFFVRVDLALAAADYRAY